MWSLGFLGWVGGTKRRQAATRSEMRNKFGMALPGCQRVLLLSPEVGRAVLLCEEPFLPCANQATKRVESTVHNADRPCPHPPATKPMQFAKGHDAG